VQAPQLRGLFFLCTTRLTNMIFYLLYYGLGKLSFGFIFRVIFRTKIYGIDRVPRVGGLLIVCNHISFVDPPLVGVVMPRPVQFMAMVELFRNRLLGAMLRGIHAIPVDRSRADHIAAREAIRRLRQGNCVAIFPEAGIRLGSESVLGGNPVFKPGASAIALLGSSAILPVIVRDTRKPYSWRNWLKRETMSLTFGHPFSLWIPDSHTGEERRAIAETVLREQLLKTVELK
jgi:1-acyl-sn-glycerol-3-phosphate acyltransferase